MARVKTTKQYIKECACCVLVAPIGRVTTDNIVHHRLMETLRRPGTQKILVTTKIDVSLTYKHQGQPILTGQDISPHTKPQKVTVNPQSIEEFRRLSDAQSQVVRELKGSKPSGRKLGTKAKMEIEQKKSILALVTIQTGMTYVLITTSFKNKQYDMLYEYHRGLLNIFKMNGY